MATSGNENAQVFTKKSTITTKNNLSSNDDDKNAINQLPIPPHDPRKRPAPSTKHQDAPKKPKIQPKQIIPITLTNLTHEIIQHILSICDGKSIASLLLCSNKFTSTLIQQMNTQETATLLSSSNELRSYSTLRRQIATEHPTISPNLTADQIKDYTKSIKFIPFNFNCHDTQTYNVSNQNAPPPK